MAKRAESSRHSNTKFREENQINYNQIADEKFKRAK